MIPNTVNRVVSERERVPKMPVLVGEVCYEGIMAASREEVQRFMFWSSDSERSGGSHLRRQRIVATEPRRAAVRPFTAWAKLGEHALGRGGSIARRPAVRAKQFLSTFEWWRMEPHPEWVDQHWSKLDYVKPYAAGIPGELRIIFVPPVWNVPKMNAIEADV